MRMLLVAIRMAPGNVSIKLRLMAAVRRLPATRSVRLRRYLRCAASDPTYSAALKAGIDRAVVGDFDLGVVFLQGLDGAGVRELISVWYTHADPSFDG